MIFLEDKCHLSQEEQHETKDVFSKKIGGYQDVFLFKPIVLEQGIIHLFHPTDVYISDSAKNKQLCKQIDKSPVSISFFFVSF